MDMLHACIWHGLVGLCTSKMLKNLEKSFLKLAATALCDVNKQRDENQGIMQRWKVMIHCSLSLSVNVQWKE